MKFKQIKPYFFFVFTLFFLTFFCFRIQADSESSGTQVPVPAVYGNLDIEMEASYGYGDAAKGGRILPILVSVTSSAEGIFEGSIKLLSMETDYDIYRYEYPIRLEPEEKKDVTLYIPIGYRTDQIYVVLENSSGEELMRKRMKLDVNLDVSELLIGVLSESPGKLDYLNGIAINYGTLKTRTTLLDTDILPESEIGLNLFDVLIITDYHTKRLSSLQTKAILEWVKQGGILLLGTGQKGAETLSAFSKDIGIDSYGESYMTTVDMGLEYSTSSPGDSSIELPCTDISIPDGHVIISSDEFTLLTAINYEKGMVAVAAYDFSDLSSFCEEHPSYMEKLFINLLGNDKVNQLSQSIYGGDYNTYWSVQNAINMGNVEKLPNVPAYMIVIFVYIAVAGPGLYVMLRRHGLRNLYRTGVLVLSMVFTVLIYLMGSHTRFKDTFLHMRQSRTSRLRMFWSIPL